MPKEFTDAPQVERIAVRLIEILKPELEGFTIRYIFASENPKKDGRDAIGSMRKITGLNAYLAGEPEGFFVLETGIPAYLELTTNQKIAYIHHELCHPGVDENGNLTLYPHDIQEFNEVAAAHGAYFDRLQIFADAVEKGNSDITSRADLIERILDE